MAVDGEESDYESDPEEALRPSVMRRREASDDEDGEGSDAGERLTRRTVGSDGESDCQGGAPVYEDDDEGEFESEEEGLGGVGEEPALEDDANGVVEEGRTSAVTVLETSGEASEYRESDQVEGEDGEEGQVEGGEEEKKASEPFAVPKAGAFYMHDDRFQENGRGRHRRMYGGRKLWESKDERAWVHDRFEEMNLQDDRYDEEKRMSRGRFRGRGNRRTRGMGRGYVREKKPQAYNDNNNQNQASRTVRGRGPRRYETLLKSDNGNHKIQYKQAAKPQEQTVKTGSVRQMLHSAHRQSEPIITNRQVFASSLSSASPPFYPSGTSSQDIPIAHKREAQLGTSSKTPLSSPMQPHENFSAPQHGSIARGKATMESANNDKLYMDDSIRFGSKTLANSHLSGSSLPLISAGQSSHSVVQGRSLTINTPSNKHPTPSINQVARVATQAQSIVLQRPGATSDQLALRVSTQQLGSRSSNGSQASSISQTVSTLSEAGETDSPPGASKSKTALVAKGKASNQATERGSLLYNGGTQVIGASGAMGLVHGDQGFPATPALLPVMQFGGQHHNGIPAVGMALPGYVARPQLGFGNSEMTWVPLLAGASGALGASYGSPYIALDSSYFTRSSGQSSSVTSRRESSVNKPADTWKQPEGSETPSDEYGQRQKNKPRRYSEMSFGQ